MSDHEINEKLLENIDESFNDSTNSKETSVDDGIDCVEINIDVPEESIDEILDNTEETFWIKYYEDYLGNEQKSEEKIKTNNKLLNKKRSHKDNFFESLSKGKRIQLLVSIILSVILIILIPAYAWFNNQREIARLERIKSPDSLFITAANREDKINIKMNEIDVNSNWNSTSTERASYKYFVFSVAGQYVVNYNLQLAHTKNNNYKYEIFEAAATNTEPNGVEGRDYIKYDPDDNRIPMELRNVTVHDGIDTDYPIYYSVKLDNSDTPISLNLGEEYTVGTGVDARTYSYDGHYLNMNSGSEYTALANDTYHDLTYSYDRVEQHAEPLYWQATNIPVIDSGNTKDPFYHEYILKVSWDTSANLADLTKYKDTDIVYITVSVQ